LRRPWRNVVSHIIERRCSVSFVGNRRFGDGPRVDMIDHADQRTDDAVVGSIEFSRWRTVYIATLDGEFQPSLGLGVFSFGDGKFVGEGRRIPPPAPTFGQICAHGARGAAYLIGQRKLFFARKALRQLDRKSTRLNSSHVKI